MDEAATTQGKGRSIWWMRRTRPVALRASRPALSTPAFSGVAIVVGLVAGVVCSVFRLTLEYLDRSRGRLLHFISGSSVWSRVGLAIVVVIATAAATGLAAWLVHRYAPQAEGSGIPRVEAVVEGRLEPAPPKVVPVKFAGGVLAIGSGLALGREGPSVQMGASVAEWIARSLRINLADSRMLMAAGAGAGLATAFNAPVAGAVFVLEELVRRFNPRTTVATLGASAAAIWVSRIIVGNIADFTVPAIPHRGSRSLVFYVVLGLLVGLAGVYYNKLILYTLDLNERLHQWSIPTKAAVIGAGVAVIGVISPRLLGGGGSLTQAILDGRLSFVALIIALIIRWFMGPISYAARTPGGIFAPLLVIGTQLGVVLAYFGHLIAPGVAPGPVALGLTGMAAFFTATVRAPVTGIVLVTEMTGASTLLLPMLIACTIAMALPGIMKQDPIYESLARRTARASRVTGVRGDTR